MKKQEVAEIAKQIVNEVGLINLTRAELCKRAGINEGSFDYLMDCTFNDFVDELRPQLPPSKGHKLSKGRARNADIRKDNIIAVALEMAEQTNYLQLQRNAIADRVGVSNSLINRHFTMTQLRSAVMRRAVQTENLSVIAQGLANKHPQALKASAKVRTDALEHQRLKLINA